MASDDAGAPSIGDGPLQTAARVSPWRLAVRLEAALEARLEAEREQLPLWLPVALGFGIAAWSVLPDVEAWRAFLLVAGAVTLVGISAAPARRWGKAILLAGLVAFLGCALVWAKAERSATNPLPFARMADFAAIVETLQPLPAQSMTRLVVRPDADSGLPDRLRINVAPEQWVEGIESGARVRLRAWLMPPAPMAVPGAYDYARVAWFQGIGGSGRALDIRIMARAERTTWHATLAGWRQTLAAHVRSQLGGGEGGIAAALATGDQGGVPEADAEAMRQSGLAHLLSVSGLHLTAVVGAVMFLVLKLLALSPVLALRWPLPVVAAGAGAMAGVGYTLLTGAEVPALRACIAALLVLLGMAMGRDALTLRLVAAGALLVLFFWPETLAGPSFQLSFAAITAIVALHEHPRIRGWLARRDEGIVRKTGRALLALVLTGLAVEVALSPIALYHFHQAGLYGAFANILAIPLTTFVIMPLEALALLLDLFGLGAPAWIAAGAALRLLLALAHATAAAPGAVATLPAIPVPAFGLMIAGALWLLLWRTGWRRWGLVPAVVGALWAVATPRPDLIVTGDGRHLALRTDQGGYAILRDRAGDYVRDLLAESAGSRGELGAIADLTGARCSRELCAIDLEKNGRRWHLLATRSSLLVPAHALARACERADIVVSDRRLPRACRPRWLKADRSLLRRSGGLAIRLGAPPKVETVRDRVGRHPWAETERRASERKRPGNAS